jgi:hypothetical protein
MRLDSELRCQAGKEERVEERGGKEDGAEEARMVLRKQGE